MQKMLPSSRSLVPGSSWQLWAALGSSLQLLAALNSSGQLWAALSSFGQLRAAPSSSGQLLAALNSSWQLWAALGNSGQLLNGRNGGNTNNIFISSPLCCCFVTLYASYFVSFLCYFLCCGSFFLSSFPVFNFVSFVRSLLFVTVLFTPLYPILNSIFRSFSKITSKCLRNRF